MKGKIEMKKAILITALIMMFLFGGCANNTTDGNSEMVDYDSIGSKLIMYLSEGKYEEIISEIDHSKDMKAVVSVSFYEDIWSSLINEYGDYQSFNLSANTSTDGYEVYSYEVLFTTHSVNFNVIFSQDGVLSGLNYQKKSRLNDDGLGSLGGELITIGDEFPLEGELVVSEGKDSMPLVIMVHGSGPSDRDETAMNIKPFYDIAEGLQELGIATYRYDKRTLLYGSEVDIDTFTIYDETIDDAVAAFNQFNEDPRFEGNVYILGHSLGGHVLPRIAELTKDAKGYIFMAANYSSLTSLISYQVEYLSEVDGEYTADEKAQVKAIRDLIEEIEELNGDEEGVFLGAGSAYWKDLNDYDPGEVIGQIDKPMLFLQGDGDYQVKPEELDFWLEKVDVKLTTHYTFEGLSHLFTPAGDPPSAVDYEGTYTFDSQVLKMISEWIQEN